MSTRSPLVDFVLDQLRDLEGVRARPMFGGHGLYAGTRFFGLVYREVLYLKTDERTRAWYEERGMDSFRPTARQHLKNYLEVPVDALEDRDQLVQLVRDAIGEHL